MILITVHDVKAGTWSPPVTVQSVGAACRDFERACQQPNTAMAFAPGDFDLYQIGEWKYDKECRVSDGDHPCLTVFDHYIKLASGADYVAE